MVIKKRLAAQYTFFDHLIREPPRSNMHFLVLVSCWAILCLSPTFALGTVKDIIDYCDSNRHDIITSLQLVEQSCLVRCGEWSEDGFHYTEFDLLCEVIDPSKFAA